MRYSCDKSDAGYGNFVSLRGKGRVEVILDGVIQVKVITADEDEGFVVRAAVDENGRVKRDPSLPGEILFERIGGVVAVRAGLL